MKTKVKENQKGITLIALVITIIVLLILASVSIAMLTGDNGILTRASDAKIETALGAVKEQIGLYQIEKKMNKQEVTAESLLGRQNWQRQSRKIRRSRLHRLKMVRQRKCSPLMNWPMVGNWQRRKNPWLQVLIW